jgi:hypothetical protein
MPWRRFAALTGLALALGLAGCGAPERPAPPTPPASTSRPATYAPGLGEIMTLQQMRHAKLWLAIEAKNWALAEYELDELQEGFADAVTFHPRHKDAPRPLGELVPETMDGPIKELRAALAARDLGRAERAHDAVTAGCNACHAAAGFSFNRVVRPSANAYSNQDFAP